MFTFNGVKRFFQRHNPENLPVLLALSGGPDSIALFYLMIECSIPFAIAHVDHGWREESAGEAQQLQALCHRFQIPFYLKTLNPESLSGNLEEACRIERQAFFKTLCLGKGYSAVVLGHHRDDQSETVLKRVLEGASMTACGGIREQNSINGVTYWRPLIHYSKEQILRWLNEKDLSFFWDNTNEDSKYLRARIRSQILPELSQLFGKEVSGNLASFGQEAQDLEVFMQKIMEQWLLRIEKGPFGLFLDLSQDSPETEFELRYLIRSMLQSPTRTIVHQAAAHLLKGSSNKKFSVGNQTLFVDRKTLLVTECIPLELPQNRVELSDGVQFGPWFVRVENGTQISASSCWRQALKGELRVVLPCLQTPYQIGKPDSATCYPRTSSLRKWWGDKKVPSFIRHWFPVVWKDDQMVHEFLSGKEANPCVGRQSVQTLILKFR